MWVETHLGQGCANHLMNYKEDSRMFFSDIIDIGLALYGSPVPRSTFFLSLFSLCVAYRKCRDLKGTGWPVLTKRIHPLFPFHGVLS